MKSTNGKIIIVGQGLAGSVLSHELRKRKIDHVVLDKEELSASSRVAAGIWNPVVFKRMTQSWLAPEIVPVMHSFYSEAENFLGIKVAEKRQMIKFFSEEHEAQLWKKKAAAELKEFIDARVYSPREFDVPGVVSPSFGFSFVKESGNLDTQKFLDATRMQLQAEDRLIEEEFDFGKLKIDGAEISYGGIHLAGIVFCQGWLNDRNPFFNYIPFKPAKGEVFTFYAPELKCDYILNKGIFILPLGNSLFKCGATYEWNELNDEVTPKRQHELEEKLRWLINVPYTVTGRSAGVRPSVIDRRPVLGCHPSLKNVYIFNGFGTKAVMLAPFFASQMCNFMFEGGDLHDEVNVNRFQKKLGHA